MLVPTQDHITYLFVWLDDNLPLLATPRVGRKSQLTNSELVTILVWNAVTVKQQTLQDVYRWLRLEYTQEFPHLPCYQNFVKHCQRALPLLIWTLSQLLDTQAPLRIMDFTRLEVCRLARADSHKVAANIADFGKNHQGWHSGFKLHTAVDRQGRLASLVFTPASYSDPQQMPKLLNQFTKLAVGDSHYGAAVMRRFVWETYGTIVSAPPHHTQRKKLLSRWQYKLLALRPKIESVFDYLKEHLHLVSSFPRSVLGYLLHYIRILLGYQVMATC